MTPIGNVSAACAAEAPNAPPIATPIEVMPMPDSLIIRFDGFMMSLLTVWIVI
ncbi:hypothetical protein CDEF62S_05707 [Castellaniella defragrans]